MSRERQIEELNAVIRDAVNGCSSYWSGLIADALYEEGYRKQIVGEWIRKDKVKGQVAPEAVCSNCGRDVEYQVIDGKWEFENYCSHCGAKMKGGAE